MSTITNDATTSPNEDKSNQFFVNIDAWDSSEEYVAWIDVMGTHSIMKMSHKYSVLATTQLHNGILFVLNQIKIQDSKNKTRFYPSLTTYPMGDGLFISSKDANAVKTVLIWLFGNLSKAFLFDKAQSGEQEPSRKIIVRAGIAKGIVYHGSNINEKTSVLLSDNMNLYTNRLFFGSPLGLAHSAEAQAPPFGIAIDSSAVGKNFSGLWFYWYKKEEDVSVTDLLDKLNQHYEWTSLNPHSNPYPIDSLNRHKAWAEEFFKRYSDTQK